MFSDNNYPVISGCFWKASEKVFVELKLHKDGVYCGGEVSE